MTTLTIPELSLVVLIGASGSGKSSFARKHFKPTEILSSDFCRGLVSDNENDQTVTKDAFELLHFIEVLEGALGKKADMTLLPMQPGDVPATYADIDDLAHDVGFSPSTSIEVGIPRFVEWYRSFYKV